MPAVQKHQPISRADHAKKMELRRLLAETTDAALEAGVAAAERGEDIAAAMRPHTTCREAQPDPEKRVLPSLDEIAARYGRLRADGWTPDRQRAFLVLLAESGCVAQSCAKLGISKQSAYALRRRAPNSMFAIGWDVAIRMARQALLDEATERALAGREQSVWHRGEEVGTRIVHNDRLLMFLDVPPRAPARAGASRARAARADAIVAGDARRRRYRLPAAAHPRTPRRDRGRGGRMPKVKKWKRSEPIISRSGVNLVNFRAVRERRAPPLVRSA